MSDTETSGELKKRDDFKLPKISKISPKIEQPALKSIKEENVRIVKRNIQTI